MPKETIQQKYARLRPFISQGDLILFHGERLLAQTIQESDNDAYFNHVGVVGEITFAKFIIDSNANGVEPDRLSERLLKYKDFCVIKPNKTTKEINLYLSELLMRQDQHKIKYDFINGAKALLNRLCRTNIFKTKQVQYRKICSMFTYDYALKLEMIEPMKDEDRLFFPQDYIRFIKNATVLN